MWSPAATDATSFIAARRVASRHAGGRTDVTWMDGRASLELLAAADVPVVAGTPDTSGLELMVGAIRDPAFGPLVVVGAGGAEAELRDDTVVLVAPVAASAARRAPSRASGWRRLFHGFQGRPELPVESVVELVQRVAMLVRTVAEIQQLDINPVLVTPDGCVAVDARIGVAAPQSAVAPVRGLRGRP